MIYLYESDGAGGHGVSDVFRRAYGEDAFASFYCPHPVPPYLEASRIGYLKNYFGAAMGLAANVCIEPALLKKDFPHVDAVIVLRHPVSASIRSYQAFLTTYAGAYWPDTSAAPAEYATLGAYLDHIRGNNHLVRALASVPADVVPGEAELAQAMAALARFDYLVFAEDFRLSLMAVLNKYPEARTLYGSDQHAALQGMEPDLSYDGMHVSADDVRVALSRNALDIRLYVEAVRLVADRYVQQGSGYAI